MSRIQCKKKKKLSTLKFKVKVKSKVKNSSPVVTDKFHFTLYKRENFSFTVSIETPCWLIIAKSFILKIFLPLCGKIADFTSPESHIRNGVLFHSRARFTTTGEICFRSILRRYIARSTNVSVNWRITTCLTGGSKWTTS